METDNSKEKKGLPGLRLLYLFVSLAILGLLLTNIQINLIWLDPLIKGLKDKFVNFELIQAQRTTESIERIINQEIVDIVGLSQDIALFKNNQDLIDTFLSRSLNENLRKISVLNLRGKEEKRYSKREYVSSKDLKDFSSREGFETARSGQIFISPVYFSPYTEPYIVIYSPVRATENEKPSSVLRVVLYLRGVWGPVLEKIKIGEKGRVLVVDEKGMLIASSNPSLVLEKINLSSLPPVKPILSGRIFRDYKRGVYLNEEGKEVVGVGAPIKSLDWGVVIEEEAKEVEGPVKRVKEFALLFLFGGIIIIGILIWLALTLRWADKKLVQKSIDLENRRRQLEEGKSVLEIKIRARTRQLEEMNKKLDKQVRDRTKDLQAKVEELERFQKLTIGRELKMIELKEEVEKLRKKIGRQPIH